MICPDVETASRTVRCCVRECQPGSIEHYVVPYPLPTQKCWKLFLGITASWFSEEAAVFETCFRDKSECKEAELCR